MADVSGGVSKIWKKSTFSNPNECVEVRHRRGLIQVRDSKRPDGVLLEFTEQEWRAFLAGVVAGEFSLPD